MNQLKHLTRFSRQSHINFLLGLLILFSAPVDLCSQMQARRIESVQDIKILVYTHTRGYRHKSIEKGVATLKELTAGEGFGLVHTEDSLMFRPDTLSEFQLVVFLSTTGDVLGPEQEDAFRSYIQNGGNFMGIHAATDTEYDWKWYGDLVGAYFESHPEQQEARLEVREFEHPSTAHLRKSFTHFDEWYNFKEVRPGLNVLLNLDETSYEGGNNGPDHPIAWYREFDGGRMFYTGLGHTEEAFEDPDFRKHLLGGILYCLGRP
jgi:type 1 glutamine amidotransferase